MNWLGWTVTAIVAVVLFYELRWKITRYTTAQNVVMAAITYRTLDAGKMGAVDGTVTNICFRLRINEDLVDGPMAGGLAVRYALRSLAMYELGIHPADDALKRWYVLRNPFNAMLAQKEIASARARYEKKHGVVLEELDPQPIELEST